MNETTLTVVKEIQASDRLAYRQFEVVSLLGICRRSLYNEIQRRKLFPTKTFRLISKAELLRYLEEETQLTRRARRTVRSKRLAHERRHNANPPQP